jgi:hypothetical protein
MATSRSDVTAGIRRLLQDSDCFSNSKVDVHDPINKLVAFSESILEYTRQQLLLVLSLIVESSLSVMPEPVANRGFRSCSLSNGSRLRVEYPSIR